MSGGGVGGGVEGDFSPTKSSGRRDRQTYPQQQQQQKELNRHSLVPSCGGPDQQAIPGPDRLIMRSACKQCAFRQMEIYHTLRSINASEQSP